jgi:periplasmic protein TonB
MSNVWLVAGAVTLATHGALATWMLQREPVVHPPIEKTVVRFKVTPPAARKEIQPPVKPPEPPPPPPRLVKRVRPKAAPTEPSPDERTKTDIVEPAESGLSPDQSASQGTMTVQGGGGIDGAIQEGTGSEKTRAAVPPPPRPPRTFVPIPEVSRMPRPIRPVQPEVPDEFRSQNREAVVVVEVAISAGGRVIGARVVKKAGFGLDEAAIDAARRTSFEPALQGDRPVAVKMLIPYRFKVRG